MAKPTTACTSSDRIRGIAVGDYVTVVGFVTSVHDHLQLLPGSGEEVNLMKIFMTNGDEQDWKAIVWRDKVAEVRPTIAVGRMIRLGGAVAHPVDNPEYQTGNLNYELVISPSTIVTRVGQREEEQDAQLNQIDHDSSEDGL